MPLLAFVRATPYPAFRVAMAVLAIPQLVVSAIAWQWPRALWPPETGGNRLLGSLPMVGSSISTALPGIRAGESDMVIALVWLAAIGAGDVLLVLQAAHMSRPT